MDELEKQACSSHGFAMIKLPANRTQSAISSDMRTLHSSITKLRERAFAPVDIASLVFFRITFGLLMVWEVCRYFANGWITLEWLEPRFLFKYYGFSWVHPWPGHWLYIHWAALGIFALFVAAGFLYRLSAALFFLSYAYFFLLDEARFANHIYLICLFSFLMIFVPAHRALSIDAWLKPGIRLQTAPAWSLWLLRFQIGVVYFFAGLAKISPDWLHGEPMRTWMADRSGFPVIGRFFREEWAIYGISYGGLLFDLFVVPLLLWRRTRVPAFCAALSFHLMNAQWWSIDFFPWLAITATALFFWPSWPRRIFVALRLARPFSAPDHWRVPSRRTQTVVLSFVSLYLAIQVLLPLRHFLWRGGVEWTYAEHCFSWRMLLLNIYARPIFYVTDPNTGRTRAVDPRQFLSPKQAGKLGYLPDFPVQFAHYLATVMPRKGPKPLQVEARILISINGRKPQLYVDPNVDLAAESRSLGRPRWLRPVREPLPPPGKQFSGDEL